MEERRPSEDFDEEKDFSDEEEVEKGPYTEEAFRCIETALKKLVEQQEECASV